MSLEKLLMDDLALLEFVWNPLILLKFIFFFFTENTIDKYKSYIK